MVTYEKKIAIIALDIVGLVKENFNQIRVASIVIQL